MSIVRPNRTDLFPSSEHQPFIYNNSVKLFFKSLPVVVSLFLLSANHKACADGVFPWPGPETLWAGTTLAGLDGQTRLAFGLWVPSTNPEGQYVGQRLFVLDTNGGIQGQCVPDIPDYNGNGDAPFTCGQKDGNTTVAAWKSDGSITIWCFNGQGKLISSVRYGPFTNASLVGFRFTESGNIALHWQSGPNADSSSHIAWLLGEYGQIITTNGPYGPYTNTSFLQIVDQKNGNQQWLWRNPPVFTSSSCTTFVWTFKGANTNGGYNKVLTNNLGPF